ncbi:hypothetical protein QZH41_019101 [Actinostola sp. cb2023]|nr:hypothetical protein QZH41_019101 [Actinostola sp. cb2023]
MNACTREFNNSNMISNDYIRNAKKESHENINENINVNADEIQNAEIQNVNVNAESQNVNVNAGSQNVNVNAGSQNVNANAGNQNVDLNAGNQNVIANTESQNADVNMVTASGRANEKEKEVKPIVSFSLRHEKPKLPVFNGDLWRVVSDVVTFDLERFKPIQLGEDHRFCDLVNLVRRSYNILKEIKRPQDIDNTPCHIPY